jgi:diaminopropionate ammonia-lyase
LEYTDDQVRLFINKNIESCTAALADSYSLKEMTDAQNEIRNWPGYQFTPLYHLSSMAKAYTLGDILYKDEESRFGLKSFKALGGAYAVCRLLQKEVTKATGKQISSLELWNGAYSDITEKITVTTATEGNHGRSIAWGANRFHCRSVIYIPKTCKAERQEAISRYGATVIRTSFGYDETVRECAREAQKNNWIIVSDTSWEGYTEIPSLVMQGYTVLASEIVSQLVSIRPPSHVFVQAGVGGLAAAIVAAFRCYWQKSVQFVVVEAEGSACLYVSAASGKLTPFPDKTQTIMAGLECGEASPIAWQVLQSCANAFLTIPDSLTQDSMKLLAAAPYGDIPIVAGESGVAGLAALRFVLQSSKISKQLGLNSDSRVLLLGTEADTAPGYYSQLTGESAETVRARAKAWNQSR